MKNTIDTSILKKTREDKGFTYRDMSNFLGAKSSATYYNIENGKTEPKASQLMIISRILKIPIQKILPQKFNQNKQ